MRNTISGRKIPENKSSGGIVNRGSKVSDFRLIKELHSSKIYSKFNRRVPIQLAHEAMDFSPITLPPVENTCNKNLISQRNPH